LICHRGDTLNDEGLARWLASFSDVVAVVAVDEPRVLIWKRIRREAQRSGLLGLLDVLMFRVYYRAHMARADRRWENEVINDLRRRYPERAAAARLVTPSPNSPAVEKFISHHAPDLTIARCKTLLRYGIFSIPRYGTFVMHPGICPEYRNSHGCFWALAKNEPYNVGMTLLQIDEGIDTGPIYGHYRCEFDPAHDSHIKIQIRVVLDNLEPLRAKLIEIASGIAPTIDVSGRASRAYGQPRLSAYLYWQRAVRSKWQHRGA
jgi:hypothetical protein